MMNKSHSPVRMVARLFNVDTLQFNFSSPPAGSDKRTGTTSDRTSRENIYRRELANKKQNKEGRR